MRVTAVDGGGGVTSFCVRRSSSTVACGRVACALALAAAGWLLRTQRVDCAVAALLLVAAAWAVARATAAETLLLLPHLGLQLERQLLSGKLQRTFVPVERVAAVVINEAVTTAGVYFYLAIALHGEQRMELPFAALRPRLAELLAPYRAANAIAFGAGKPPSWPAQADADAVPRVSDTLLPWG